MAAPYHYFRIEAEEILEQLQKTLLQLEKGGSVAELVPRLLRLAHTLKGAARVVRHASIADQTHAIESALVPVRDSVVSMTPAIANELLERVDVMRAALLALSRPEGPATTSAELDPSPADADADEPFRTARPNAVDLEMLVDGIVELDFQLGGLRRAGARLGRARQLSEVVAGQLSPRRASVPTRRGSNDETRLRLVAGDLQKALETVERELLTSLEQASRELSLVRDAAERLQLVPAALMWASLERTARDAALTLGKQVRFESRGGEVRLDANMMNLVQRALVQAVRNAIAHGIESSESRVASDKPIAGHVAVEVTQRDKTIAFVCRDDGGGLDLDAVRRTLREGRSSEAAADALDDEGLIQLLLRGGISTSPRVTEMAGRGIGLDLVRETADSLGGTVSLRTSKGLGTELTLTVPVSLSALSVLVVAAAGQAVAIPLSAVRRTGGLQRAEIAHTVERDTLVVDGVPVTYAPLGSLLSRGSAEPHPTQPAGKLVIVEAELGVVALGVDQLVGQEDIVARALPGLICADPIVMGASLDQSGNPRLVLSPQGLVAAALRARVPALAPAKTKRPILIIDDSLTTRMLERSILESAGYEVELATSGEEGLEKARQRGYGLFLVDVEMPGMDGFTFIEHTRMDPELREVPAILVTSRATPEDFERGRSVGAGGHILKGEFDQSDLLEKIRRLVG